MRLIYKPIFGKEQDIEVKQEDLARICNMATSHLIMMQQAEGNMFPAIDKDLLKTAEELYATLAS